MTPTDPPESVRAEKERADRKWEARKAAEKIWDAVKVGDNFIDAYAAGMLQFLDQETESLQAKLDEAERRIVKLRQERERELERQAFAIQQLGRDVCEKHLLFWTPVAQQAFLDFEEGAKRIRSLPLPESAQGPPEWVDAARDAMAAIVAVRASALPIDPRIEFALRNANEKLRDVLIAAAPAQTGSKPSEPSSDKKGSGL